MEHMLRRKEKLEKLIEKYRQNILDRLYSEHCDYYLLAGDAMTVLQLKTELDTVDDALFELDLQQARHESEMIEAGIEARKKLEEVRIEALIEARRELREEWNNGKH